MLQPYANAEGDKTPSQFFFLRKISRSARRRLAFVAPQARTIMCAAGAQSS